MKRVKLTMLALVLTLALMGGAVVAANSAPSGLTAEMRPDDVLLRWTPGTDEDYTGQWVKVWEVGKPFTEFSWSIKADLSSVSVLRQHNLEVGKTYNFQIAGAVQEEEDGFIDERGQSNIATLTVTEVEPEPEPQPQRADPPAEAKPTNLAAASADGQVTLTWTPGNDADYVAQEIKRRPVKGRSWTTIRIDKSASEYVDTDVDVGTKYRYRVKGVWDNGKGRISKPVSVLVK